MDGIGLPVNIFRIIEKMTVKLKQNLLIICQIKLINNFKCQGNSYEILCSMTSLYVTVYFCVCFLNLNVK